MGEIGEINITVMIKLWRFKSAHPRMTKQITKIHSEILFPLKQTNEYCSRKKVMKIKEGKNHKNWQNSKNETYVHENFMIICSENAPPLSQKT
jgi:hypothetical protein